MTSLIKCILPRSPPGGRHVIADDEVEPGRRDDLVDGHPGWADSSRIRRESGSQSNEARLDTTGAAACIG